MQNSKYNKVLAITLGLVALSIGASVFWWRFSHKLPPMPGGSVYGSAYLPVSLPPQGAPEAPQPQQPEIAR